MPRIGLAAFSSACILSGVALLVSGKDAELPVVPNVDLKRYEGKWYEFARLPNRFQRKCAGDVTAVYTLRSSGKISVENSCKEVNGRRSTAKGSASVASKNSPNSKLKVTFFWPFKGDYWIIDLDPDYRWAMVGTPNREYLWILSRSPRLLSSVYDKLRGRAQSLGFDTSRIEKTSQTPQS